MTYYQTDYPLQSSANSRASLKRLYKEIELNLEEYDTLVTIYHNHIDLMIVFPKNIDEPRIPHQFIFKIPVKYPFLPPISVSIHGQDYYKMMSNYAICSGNRNIQANVIRRMTKKQCLCCESLLCQDKWSPSNKISEVITEILNFIELRRIVWEIKLLEKIKFMYLIDDIPLLDYLC